RSASRTKLDISPQSFVMTPMAIETFMRAPPDVWSMGWEHTGRNREGRWAIDFCTWRKHGFDRTAEDGVSGPAQGAGRGHTRRRCGDADVAADTGSEPCRLPVVAHRAGRGQRV